MSRLTQDVVAMRGRFQRGEDVSPAELSELLGRVRTESTAVEPGASIDLRRELAELELVVRTARDALGGEMRQVNQGHQALDGYARSGRPIQVGRRLLRQA